MSDEKKRAMNTPMMHQEKSELKCTELKKKQTDTVYRKRSEIIVENVRLTVGQLIALRRRGPCMGDWYFSNTDRTH